MYSQLNASMYSRKNQIILNRFFDIFFDSIDTYVSF